MVDSSATKKFALKLHDLLFSDVHNEKVFGEPWIDFTDAPKKVEDTTLSKAWWRQRREDLLALASNQVF